MNEKKYKSEMDKYYFPRELNYTPCFGLNRAASFIGLAIDNYRSAEYPESVDENEIALPYKNFMYTILYSEWAINSILKYYQNLASIDSKKQAIYDGARAFNSKYRSVQTKKKIYRLFRSIQIKSFGFEHNKFFDNKVFPLDYLQLFDNIVVFEKRRFSEIKMSDLSNCAKNALKAVYDLTRLIDETDKVENACDAVFFPFVREKESRRSDINKKKVYPILGIQLLIS